MTPEEADLFIAAVNASELRNALHDACKLVARDCGWNRRALACDPPWCPTGTRTLLEMVKSSTSDEALQAAFALGGKDALLEIVKKVHAQPEAHERADVRRWARSLGDGA